MKEITPEKLRCGIGMCPALFELDDGRVVIIGKMPTAEQPLPSAILERIGVGEASIIIPAEYLEDLER